MGLMRVTLRRDIDAARTTNDIEEDNCFFLPEWPVGADDSNMEEVSGLETAGDEEQHPEKSKNRTTKCSRCSSMSKEIQALGTQCRQKNARIAELDSIAHEQASLRAQCLQKDM